MLLDKVYPCHEVVKIDYFPGLSAGGHAVGGADGALGPGAGRTSWLNTTERKQQGPA